jgi:putative Ca2+/H+ antiporter (TMEM165/GDT1 family)
MEAFLTAAGLVFVAELGDKTQLVALSLGARYRLVPVLAGIALAYAATNLLSVVVGGVLGAALPTAAIGIAGGLLFSCSRGGPTGRSRRPTTTTWPSRGAGWSVR